MQIGYLASDIRDFDAWERNDELNKFSLHIVALQHTTILQSITYSHGSAGVLLGRQWKPTGNGKIWPLPHQTP